MARTGVVSATMGVLAAIAAFVALQFWTPPAMVLGWLGNVPTRHPAPERPFHTLAVRPAAGGDVLVTEADVVNARVSSIIAGGTGGAALELSKTARDRLAAYAGAHGAESIIVAVDGQTITTGPASTFAGDAAKTIAVPAAAPLETNADRLAAHFGGALDPTPSYLFQAARLAVALIAGLVVLFLVMLVTRR